MLTMTAVLISSSLLLLVESLWFLLLVASPPAAAIALGTRSRIPQTIDGNAEPLPRRE